MKAKSAIGFMMCALVFVTTTHAEVPPEYILTDLGTLGGDWSIANDINDGGQVVGSANLSNGTTRAYIWENGQMRDLGALPGGSASYAYAINNLGCVVGSSTTTSSWSPYNAFLWDGSTMHDLGRGATNTYASDVNDSGCVVGTDAMGWDAMYWENGVMQYLPGLGGFGEVASAINNSGLIAGYAQNSSGWHEAVVWENGVVGSLGIGGSYADDINDVGEICGTLINTGFFWDPDDGLTELVSPNSGVNQALGLNNLSQVVGYFYLPSTGGPAQKAAFIWEDGVMYNLNDLIPPGSSLNLIEAQAINDLGQIVGRGDNASGQWVGFLLTPIPEPATLSLLAVGAVALIRRRRK